MTALTDAERADLRWGFKFVGVDLTTDDYRGGRHRYQLGQWHDAEPGDREFSRDPSACPQFPGDGLCVARTLTGASSGGHRVGASTMLIVGFRPGDVLAETANKVLVSRLWVDLDLVDPVRLLEWAVATGANLSGADLRGADLRGANLYGANLSWANLYEANLYGANLYGANLSGANLYGANLYGANLSGANLRWANLSWANLRWANLSGADLREADLRWADLRWADLREADLREADLRWADLRWADLRGADLTGADVGNSTIIPDGWSVVDGRVVPS